MTATPPEIPDADEPGRQVVDLGHVRLHALTWGPEDGPLAVCLHGFPDSAWTWRLLGPELAAAGFRVVAPFTRGYAPSEIPRDRDFHVAALASDAFALHAALGGDEDAVLIGHDWGAMTANALAHRADNPYRTVVSMAVPPAPAMRRALADGVHGLRLGARQMVMSWYIAFNQLPWIPERSLGWFYPMLWRTWRRHRQPRSTYQLELDRALAAVPTRAHASAVLGYYRALRRPRVDAPYRDFRDDWLGEPQCAMLYLHGADDGCMQSQFSDYVRDTVPARSEVAVIAGAGHFLHLDRPAEVNSRILEFLRRDR